MASSSSFRHCCPRGKKHSSALSRSFASFGGEVSIRDFVARQTVGSASAENIPVTSYWFDSATKKYRVRGGDGTAPEFGTAYDGVVPLPVTGSGLLIANVAFGGESDAAVVQIAVYDAKGQGEDEFAEQYLSSNTAVSEFIRTINDGGIPLCTTADEEAANAFYSIVRYYEMLAVVFGRVGGLTGSSHVLASVANVDFVNAFWTGFMMCFGRGSPSSGIRSLTSSDVCGHELTHGLQTFSTEFVYQGESGALNESIADLFGTLLEFYINSPIDTPDYTMGEAFGHVIRNIANPEAREQPSKRFGKFWANTSSEADNGGVHTNSGVTNYLFYLAACVDKAALTLTEYAKIVFAILFDRSLSTTCELSDFANSVIAKTESLHGADVVTKVRTCVEAVNLGSGGSGSPPGETPSSPPFPELPPPVGGGCDLPNFPFPTTPEWPPDGGFPTFPLPQFPDIPGFPLPQFPDIPGFPLPWFTFPAAAGFSHPGRVVSLPSHERSTVSPVLTGEAVLSSEATTTQRADWGHVVLGIPAAWNEFKVSGAGVKVAILDTGIDRSHPDLASSVAEGINLSSSPTWESDPQGHGTHCAGIVAAVNNTIGVVGAAPGARLYIAKVLNDNGEGTVGSIVRGIDWAVSRKVDVISMSLGGDGPIDGLLRAAIDRAIAARIIVVAAAGNSGPYPSTIGAPGNYTPCVTVGAINSSLAVAPFSSRGGALDVCAPGVGIMSTYTAGRYAALSGTSMATPYVAAVAALFVEVCKRFPSSSAAHLPALFSTCARDTARDLGVRGVDNDTGAGLIVPKALLARAIATLSAAPAPAPVPAPAADDDRVVDITLTMRDGRKLEVTGVSEIKLRTAKLPA